MDGSSLDTRDQRLGQPSQSESEKHAGTGLMLGRPRVASLFSGIGGFDRAFELAGARVDYQCELDEYCRAVLQRHWPGLLVSSDIRQVMPSSLPFADVWAAGFPCQDVSLARGNHGRTGLRGNHTSLFYELIRLAKAKEPEVIVLENVVGLLNSHKGRDFAIILDELMRLDYAVSWRVLNARYFGVPQSRMRVFLVAWKSNSSKSLLSVFEERRSSRTSGGRNDFLIPSVHEATGAIVPQTAYCLAATSGRHTGNDWSRSYVSYENRLRRPTPTESERLQGFDTDWSIPSDEFRIPARGLDSERYRAIGNAVAIPVVRWIAENVVAQIKAPASNKLGAELSPLTESLPDFRSSAEPVSIAKLLQASEDQPNFTYRWKSGGTAWKGHVFEASPTQAPSKIRPSKFVDVLDMEIPDEKYFISANAAAGMLRRADKMGRKFFPPMRTALERLVSSIPSESQTVLNANTEDHDHAFSGLCATGT
ncbi:DNA (cytosine-5-)-methyltransferase [Ruegeria pomeroyi]|nr:DNA (cytosine-5-)-methyltransferase [Ruegeria pomeroyi]